MEKEVDIPQQMPGNGAMPAINEEYYEKTRDNQTEGNPLRRIQILTGKPVSNDASLIEGERFDLVSKKTGRVHFLALHSKAHTEEDIAQLRETQENVEIQKRREKEEALLQKASRAVLETIGQYFPLEVLNEFFPGLELENINSYDFGKARIRITLLGKDELETYYKEQFNKDAPAGFTKQVLSVGKNITFVNATERIPVHVKDIDPSQSEIHPKMIYTAIHELLHHLIAGSYAGEEFQSEGLIEFYTQLVKQKRPEMEEGTEGYIAYGLETAVIAKVFNTVVRHGVSPDEVHRAFISGDRTQRARINAIVSPDSEDEGRPELVEIFKPDEHLVRFLLEERIEQGDLKAKFQLIAFNATRRLAGISKSRMLSRAERRIANNVLKAARADFETELATFIASEEKVA